MDKYLELMCKQSVYIYKKKLELADITKNMNLIKLKKEVLFKKINDLNLQEQKLNERLELIKKYENVKKNFKKIFIKNIKSKIPFCLISLIFQIFSLIIFKIVFKIAFYELIISFLFALFMLSSYIFYSNIKNYLDLKDLALNYNEEQINKDLELIKYKKTKIASILNCFLNPKFNNLEQKSIELNNLIKQIESDRILLESERNKIIDEIIIDSEFRLNFNFKIKAEGKNQMLKRIKEEGI